MHVAVWRSEAIAATTWDDTLDTWLSVSRLRGELRGERSREILRQIFDSQELCDALGAVLLRHLPLGRTLPGSCFRAGLFSLAGMANQLQHIRRDGVNGGNAIPEGLLKRLKHECGAHIKQVRALLSVPATLTCVSVLPCSALSEHARS